MTVRCLLAIAALVALQSAHPDRIDTYMDWRPAVAALEGKVAANDVIVHSPPYAPLLVFKRYWRPDNPVAGGMTIDHLRAIAAREDRPNVWVVLSWNTEQDRASLTSNMAELSYEPGAEVRHQKMLALQFVPRHRLVHSRDADGQRPG